MAPCPTHDRLERYAIGGLSEPDRQELEKHAHDCAECRLILAAMGLAFTPGTREQEALVAWLSQARPVDELLAAIGVGAGPGGGPAGREPTPVIRLEDRAARRRSWRGFAGGLAAAAAAVLVLVALPAVQEGAPAPELPRRAIAARASAMRHHAPYLGTRGGTDALPEDPFAKAEAEALARRTADPEEAARTLAGLYLWRGDAGDLERAAAELSAQDESAAVLNDRAALLFASGSPAEALPLLDRALAADAGLAPALFNRALVLEALDRRSEAEAAWDRYLAAASGEDAGWIAEARARRAELAR